jgi:hypothetical protein
MAIRGVFWAARLSFLVSPFPLHLLRSLSVFNFICWFPIRFAWSVLRPVPGVPGPLISHKLSTLENEFSACF